jgi:hypothetical protein
MMILTRQHAEILARASGLKVRVDLELVAGEVLIDVVLPGGRAGFRLMIVLVPFRSAFACCKREISASIRPLCRSCSCILQY